MCEVSKRGVRNVWRNVLFQRRDGHWRPVLKEPKKSEKTEGGFRNERIVLKDNYRKRTNNLQTLKTENDLYFIFTSFPSSSCLVFL